MRNKYLPSKKFLIIILILISIPLLIFLIKKIYPHKKYTVEQKKFLDTKISDFATLDTDEDGLYDWEEALWNTDPNKEDTDGNGENDKIYTEIIKKELDISGGKNTDGSKITETERFAMEFFTIFSSLNQKGLIDPNNINNIGDVFANKISDPIIIDESSIEIDFSIIDPSPQNKELYKADVLKILTDAQDLSIGKEIEYFANYMSNQTKENENLIKNIAKTYADMSSKLNEINVPFDAADLHKELVINSQKIALSISFLIQYEKDPVLSLKGFDLYEKTSSELEQNIYSLSSYFQKNK